MKADRPKSIYDTCDCVITIKPWENEMTLNNDDRILKYKLEQLLRDNIMNIMFTKVNGEERHMRCTLRPDLLPVPGWKPGTEGFEKEGRHKIPEHCMAVWDLEEKGWRSFRVHNVWDYMVVRDEV